MEKYEKLIYLGGIVTLAGFQLGAWYLGHNGQITALCSAGIGALIGMLTGLKIKFKEN